MLSRLTTRRKELLTGLCGLAIALGLSAWGEALVTWVQQSELFNTVRVEEMQTEFDVQVEKAFYFQESTGLKLAVPGARFFRIYFNSLGFRGPELNEDQDDETIRIAFLGNSTTLDRRVFPDEKSWPALTTQKLEEAFPGCRFAYQNAGIIGMSSRQITAFYREMLTRFRPDVVVVMTDDRSVTLRRLAKELGLSEGPSDKFSFTREQLLSHYEKNLSELLELVRQQDAIPVLLGFAQSLRENQSSEDQARSAQEAMAPMPYMSVESFLRSATWYDEKTREIAAHHQVTYIDWLKRVPPEAEFFYNFRHFNAQGSALMAEILVDEMKSSPIFSKALASRFGCERQTGDQLSISEGQLQSGQVVVH